MKISDSIKTGGRRGGPLRPPDMEDMIMWDQEKGKERDYWLNQLSGGITRSVFPYDKDRIENDIKGTDRKEERYQLQATSRTGKIEGKTFEGLMKLRNGSDYRLHMILVAVAVVQLYKNTENKEILVGTPIYKQKQTGEFINTVLALKHQVTETNSFKELLQHTRQVITEAVENQNYPIETLMYKLNIPMPEEMDFPLFDVAILLENVHDIHYIKHLNLNIRIQFTRKETHLEIHILYNSKRYKADTIQRIQHLYLNLLERLLCHPQQPIKEVELISPGEKKQILEEFNQPNPQAVKRESILQRFRNQVKKKPGAMAVTSETHHLTYHCLFQKSENLALHLRKKGIQPETIAAILMHRTQEVILCIMGILKAGGAYLVLEPENPPQRNESILKDARPKVILTQRETWETKISETGIPHPSEYIENIDLLEQDQETMETSTPKETGPKERLEPEDQENHLAYILYTSGSTGMPKGVLVQRGNLENLVFGLRERIYHNWATPMRIALLSPFVFDASVKQIFAALLMGHHLIIVPERIREEPGKLLEYYLHHKVEISDGTPTHLRILTHQEQTKTKELGVRAFILGGEALKKGEVKEFFKRYPEKTPKIYNVYGPTECSVDATCYEITAQNIEDYPDIPIGKPMKNHRVYLLNQQNQEQPISVIGEICIGGKGVSRGYLNQVELTHDRYPEDPYTGKGIKQENLYHTGDYGKWKADGNLEYHGRRDQQVKIRGIRIELGEIEQRLLKHPQIKEIFVLVNTKNNQEQMNPQEEPVIWAYIRYKKQKTRKKIPNTQELRQYLSQWLPGNMLPHQYIPIGEIPLTPNGKVDVQALPMPGGQHTTLSGSQAPGTELERRLREVWAETLGLFPETIGIEQDFFELGGHSLTATILLSRIHKEFQVNLRLKEVFNYSTIRTQAMELQKKKPVIYRAIPKAEEKEYYDLSDEMKRLYYEQKATATTITYNISTAVILEGKVEKQKIEDTFWKLIKRHESLRTSFRMIGDEPVQQIHLPGNVNFTLQFQEHHQKSILRPEEPEQTVGEILKEFVTHFELEKPSLLRAAWVKIETRKHILVVDLHHMVSDGTSIGILIRDFMDYYEKKTLCPLKIQYRDYTEWQKKNIKDKRKEIEKKESYWITQLKGELPEIELPTDYPRPGEKSPEGTLYHTHLEEEYTEWIKQTALARRTTPYVVLLTLYTIFLHKITGQEDIIIGTPVAGRRHPDLQNNTGMYVNTLAIRTYPQKKTTFKQLLTEVHDTVYQAFENQDYPFQKLVNQLNRPRKLSRSPLFDVFFALQNMEIPEIQISGLTLKPIQYKTTVSRFELSFFVYPQGEHWEIMVEYCTKLFKEETIQLFIKNFKHVLWTIKQEDSIPLQEIPVEHGYKTTQTQMTTLDFSF
jgi:amino acid adenylation domain-containing protein